MNTSLSCSVLSAAQAQIILLGRVAFPCGFGFAKGLPAVAGGPEVCLLLALTYAAVHPARFCITI
jgi:hypothetical protein